MLSDLRIVLLNYDSERETASFNIKAKKDGKSVSLMGSLPVQTPGDLPESKVRKQSLAEIKLTLRAIADGL